MLSDNLRIDEVTRQAAKQSRKPEEHAIAGPGTEVQMLVDIKGSEQSKAEHSLRTKLGKQGFVVVDSAPVEVRVTAQERATGQRLKVQFRGDFSKDQEINVKEINATLSFHKGSDTWKRAWKVPIPSQVRARSSDRAAPMFYEQMWKDFRTSIHRRQIPRWVFPSSENNPTGLDTEALGIGETQLALNATRPGDPEAPSQTVSELHEAARRDHDEHMAELKRRRDRIRKAIKNGSDFPTFDESPQEIEDDEQARRKYLEKSYVELIAGDDDAVERRLRWFPAAKRPVVGLRWGLGVEIETAGQTKQPSIAEVGDLQEYTGTIGGDLVVELNERTADGIFGAWPRQGERRLREVALAGGKSSDLLATARRQALDAMVIIELSTQRSGFRGRPDTSMKVHVVDVRGKVRRWTSPTVSSNALAAAQRSGQDPAAELVAKVTKHIDEQYRLAKMPKISASAARRRASSLTALKTASPLEILTELRYYHAKNLLTDEEAAKYYDAVLGAGQGLALLQGTVAERQQLLRAWLEKRDAANGASAR